MDELVVISGKGGTGKTSLVAAFAALAPNAVLADCDVDAADLHLVLEPQIERRNPFYGGHVATIRPADCTGCGVCAEVCRFAAVHPTEGLAKGATDRHVHAVDLLSCEGCGVCVHFCPEQAIDFPECLCGEWYVSRTRFGPMAHARLGIAADNSGKLVTRVRQEARRMAEERLAKDRGTGRATGEEGEPPLILVDGPPGIGCPVMAAITGATLLLAVTEPTASGEHDLVRVVDLADHFEIPMAACINKADINPEAADRITRLCTERGVRVVGRIPYDPEVTRAQVARRTVIEQGDSPAARALRGIWSEVVQLLNARGERTGAIVPKG